MAWSFERFELADVRRFKLEALAPNGTNHSLYIRQTQAGLRTAPALRFVSGNGM
jgi:hypothetical protein